MKALYILPLVAMLGIATTGCDDDDVKVYETEYTPLRVMSYNIRSAAMKEESVENEWPQRREPSINMLLDYKPDLVGIQEAQPVQREDLVEGVGDIYGLFSAVDDGVDDVYTGHTAILYRKDRFDVLDKGHFWLSPTPDEVSQPAWNATDRQYRTTVWMKLHDNKAGKDILLINTHLPYKTADVEARTACIDLIVERMIEMGGLKMPVFITGDMNASWYTTDSRRSSLQGYFARLESARENCPKNLTPSVYSYNAFGLSTPAVTWNIDHIFYREAIPVDFAVVNKATYGVKYISDHYPIVLNCKY